MRFHQLSRRLDLVLKKVIFLIAFNSPLFKALLKKQKVFLLKIILKTEKNHKTIKKALQIPDINFGGRTKLYDLNKGTKNFLLLSSSGMYRVTVSYRKKIGEKTNETKELKQSIKILVCTIKYCRGENISLRQNCVNSKSDESRKITECKF